MSTSTLLLAASMSAAEIAGAGVFLLTKNSVYRALLSCFGLGFALFIVVADIVPDAVEDYPLGYLLFAAGIACCAALMFKAGRRGGVAGKAAAVAGMGLHNVCEGLVLAVAGPAASPVVLIGAIAHKLPEGIVVLSLMDGAANWLKTAVVLTFALLIPAGTFLALPGAFLQPLLGFAAGVMFVALAKSLVLVFTAAGPRTRAAGVTTAGAVLAGMSCLVI